MSTRTRWKKLGKEAKSKACWDHSHMAVPDWECLLEAAVIAWLPWDVGRGRRDRNVDVFGGVRACACGERTRCQNRLLKNRHTDTDTDDSYERPDFIDLDDNTVNLCSDRLSRFLTSLCLHMHKHTKRELKIHKQSDSVMLLSLGLAGLCYKKHLLESLTNNVL